MTKTRRQFTPEKKRRILQEAERQNVAKTIRKYNLAHPVLNYWKKIPIEVTTTPSLLLCTGFNEIFEQTGLKAIKQL